VTTFIEGYRSDPGRSVAAADFLRRLPTSDVVWTDGFVPSPLAADVQVFKLACGLQKMLILLFAVLLSWL